MGVAVCVFKYIKTGVSKIYVHNQTAHRIVPTEYCEGCFDHIAGQKLARRDLHGAEEHFVQRMFLKLRYVVPVAKNVESDSPSSFSVHTLIKSWSSPPVVSRKSLMIRLVDKDLDVI